MDKKPYAVGYVMAEEVTSLWHECLLDLLYYEAKGTRGWPPRFRSFSGPVLHRGRNRLVKAFLNDDESDRLLMIDTDILFTPEDVERLIAHDEPIVSGIYTTISPWTNIPELIVDGCGFIVIHRDVLQALAPHAFDPMIMRDSISGEMEMSGEDIGFRVRAHEAGFNILIDPEIRLKHCKMITIECPSNEIDVAGLHPSRYEGVLDEA